MILKLESAVTDVSPVPLNDDPANPADLQVMLAMGFGRDSLDGVPTETLQKVDIDQVPFQDCTAQLGGVTTIKDELMICGGGSERNVSRITLEIYVLELLSAVLTPTLVTCVLIDGRFVAGIVAGPL